jgi:hypothetical protein
MTPLLQKLRNIRGPVRLHRPDLSMIGESLSFRQLWRRLPACTDPDNYRTEQSEKAAVASRCPVIRK